MRSMRPRPSLTAAHVASFFFFISKSGSSSFQRSNYYSPAGPRVTALRSNNPLTLQPLESNGILADTLPHGVEWLRAKAIVDTTGQPADRRGYAPTLARNRQDR